MSKIIACDVDGVVADLHTEWLRRYNEDFRDNLRHSDVTLWEIHKLVKPACGEKIYDYLYQAGLYDNIQPFPGAVDGIRLLRSVGYQVVFASSCPGTSANEKQLWLSRYGLLKRKYIGRQHSEDFIAINDKKLLDVDLIIDDRDKYCLEQAQKGTKAVLFDAPYNKGLRHPLVTRITGWNEIKTILQALE